MIHFREASIQSAIQSLKDVAFDGLVRTGEQSLVHRLGRDGLGVVAFRGGRRWGHRASSGGRRKNGL